MIYRLREVSFALRSGVDHNFYYIHLKFFKTLLVLLKITNEFCISNNIIILFRNSLSANLIEISFYF